MRDNLDATYKKELNEMWEKYENMKDLTDEIGGSFVYEPKNASMNLDKKYYLQEDRDSIASFMNPTHLVGHQSAVLSSHASGTSGSSSQMSSLRLLDSTLSSVR